MLFKDINCPNCHTYHDPTLNECPNCHKDNELYKLNRVPKRVVFLHPIAQVAMFIIGFAYAGMLIAEIIFAYFIGMNGDTSAIQKSVWLMLTTYLAMFAGLMAVNLFTRRDLFFSKFTNGIDYLYGLAYAITLITLGSVLNILISLIHPTAVDNANQSAAVTMSLNYPLLMFFVVGLLGPICEELTYRVGLYSFLRRINKWAAIVIVTIVFALIHFEFGADDMETELWALPSYLLSGAILTYAYEHRGPACSISAHITYNIFAFALIFVQNHG